AYNTKNILLTLTSRTIRENQKCYSNGVIASKEFGMIAGCDTEDAFEKGAAKIYNLITGADTEEARPAGDAGNFALMGVTSETKLNNHLVQTKKWRISSKNLFILIDSSMSVRTKVGLGFNNYIRENKLGWDDSAFSVFTTNSEDVEGRPLFNRFAKTDSITVVPPPLSGDYTSLSDHIDLDESQMSYGTKSTTSSDSKSVSNDFVSCDDSDNSSEVNTNDFASSDSSFKSSEPKPNDSTSYASTSSVSTSENEAEIESNVRTPIQEPIIVYDLPSFSCNNLIRMKTLIGLFVIRMVILIKRQVILEKNASSVSKLCFVCGSGTHLIKDCDFYEKQMVNKTVGIGVGPVHSRNKVNHQNQFVPKAVLLRTGKENPFPDAEDEGVFDSGCSRSMTGNKERLDDFQVFQGGKVMFGGVKICDKKNRVLFTDTECLVLSKDFKLLVESMVVLKVPKKHNLYTINLNNLCPREHKDETYPILKDFINLVENQLNKKVKAMRCDNGTEFKNAHIIELCGSKRINREYSNARTPQQNRVAERKNKTLIEAAKTMLADSKLPTMFWTEAVKTACYVLNRVLVTSLHNKTPYALLTGNIPSVSHLKPFGCHVTILNKSDHLGKFDGKDDEGYIVGYSASNKAYRELARLKGHEQRATSDAARLGLRFANDAEELQKRASAKIVPSGSIPVPTGSILVPSDLGNHDPSHGIFSSLSYDDEFGAALNNVASTMEVSPVATKRINTIHPQYLIIGDHISAVQTRSKVKQTTTGESAFINYIYDQQRDNHTDFQHCKYAIRTKWILKNKRDARGIIVQNKARLVAQGHRHEEGIDYDEMDVKSAFLYERIDEEDWCDEFKALMKGEFQMSVMGELTFFLGLQVQQRPDGIFINQDKYVQEILNKFDLRSVRTATTPYEAPKPKSKNDSDSPVNVYLYRSMIGSLMYLTTSRPDIMFAVSACSRNQVTPTTSNLEAVKKIFKYLKVQPKLGLWYPRESPLVLEAYSNSDYARANKDRKLTTGGCQFLGRRLISWQCKKQTNAATSSTEAEYVVAANCCGQPNGSRGWISDF
nr:uncharacterized mitochondrial protein AtMg00810-like [Tanacetum cinerariifolium]